jgi:hypothetical protein
LSWLARNALIWNEKLVLPSSYENSGMGCVRGLTDRQRRARPSADKRAKPSFPALPELTLRERRDDGLELRVKTDV